MRNFPLSLLLLGAVAISLLSCHKTDANATSDEQIQEIRYEYGIPVDSFTCTQGVVPSGATLGGLLRQLGTADSVVNQLNFLPKEEFDPRTFRAGKPYLAFYGADSLLHYFVYEQDRVQSFVFSVRDSLHLERQIKQIRYEPRTCHITIESSLWNAFVGQGLNPALAIELSDIYAWTVDFFGLQKGDQFEAYYTESFVDSVSIGIARIHAAAYLHGQDTLYAYFFENDEVKGYFDPSGKSLKKAFLKAPLNYKRISSTFTYHRRHPIFKTVRPHTGVDYAAPLGTPVVSIGDGTVIEKGYKGGGGNTVKIRYNSVYTTGYMHLSKYGKIQVGKRVMQGEVIGYVGSTGNSTGPHLDFRVWKNGSPINPLTMEAPPVEPVPNKYKADFDSVCVALRPHLN